MCKDLMLIIEVDGITHIYEEVIKNDEKRQNELEKAGFKVLRFSDYEVLNHINHVAQSIEAEVREIIHQNSISLPKPRLRRKKL